MKQVGIQLDTHFLLSLGQCLLLMDVEKHFQALARTPAEILRHIGSPFAPDKGQAAPLPLAQAASPTWKLRICMRANSKPTAGVL